MSGKGKNHFEFLNLWAKAISARVEVLRVNKPGYYRLLQGFLLLIVAITSAELSHIYEKWWLVILTLTTGLGIFVAIFAYDYWAAQRINHQFLKLLR